VKAKTARIEIQAENASHNAQEA